MAKSRSRSRSASPEMMDGEQESQKHSRRQEEEVDGRNDEGYENEN